MNWFKQLLSDGEQPSTYRVAMFVVLIPAMIVWSVLSIKQGQLIIPDQRVITFLISIFGGKVAQSAIENISSITQQLKSAAATPLPPSPMPTP